VIKLLLILGLAAAPSRAQHIFPAPLNASPLKCYLFVFGDPLHVNRPPISKLLAGAKYRPMNPPVDLMINPLIKAKHDTQDVDESLLSAYC
jgi:hypothetical protein